MAPTVVSASPIAELSPREYRTPRFHLETIAVEGVRRASPDVIVSESLLEEGRPYTEGELQDAMSRVNRLPFILEAAFRLGRGSERGRYRLLIEVREVRSFFFGVDLVHSTFGSPLEESSPFDEGLSDALSAGARFFVGDGVLFAAVGENENVQLGYTHYRLFGSRLFLNVAVAREGCCSIEVQDLGLDPAAGVWTASDDARRIELSVGLPLAGNHALRLDATRLESDSGHRRSLEPLIGDSFFDFEDFEEQGIELTWVYDTTDDPIFPERGDTMRASVAFRRLDSEFVEASQGVPSFENFGMSSRLLSLAFAGSRHWPIARRQALGVELRLLVGRAEVENVPVRAGPRAALLRSGDLDILEADFGVRYSLDLRGPKRTRRHGDLRWETTAGVLYVDTSPAFDPASQPLRGVRVSTAVALRNSWGVFRFGFAYLDLGGDA